jgi:hypothetical protein
LKGWKKLVDNVRCPTTATYPSPAAAVTKKLLQFRTKEEWKMKMKRGLWWRYALLDKEHMEDRQHREEGECTLLLHDLPLTHSKVHTYQKSSGSTFPHAISLLKSSTMDTR